MWRSVLFQRPGGHRSFIPVNYSRHLTKRWPSPGWARRRPDSQRGEGKGGVTYSAQFTLHELLCKIYSALFTLQFILCPIYSAQFTLRNLASTIYLAQFSLYALLCKIYSVQGYAYTERVWIFNRPGVAGAVLQSPPWLIHWLSEWSFSPNIFQTLSIPNRKS